MIFFKKKNESSSCGCGGCCSAPASEVSSDVKVLGSGCAKCNQLEQATKEALQELGHDMEIEHVRDVMEIAKYGVMSTPALVVKGKVVSYGKVLSKDEAVKLLQENL